MSEFLKAGLPLFLAALITLFSDPVLTTIVGNRVKSHYDASPKSKQIGFQPEDMKDVAIWSIDQCQILLVAVANPVIALAFGPSNEVPNGVLAILHLMLTLAALATWAFISTWSPQRYVERGQFTLGPKKLKFRMSYATTLVAGSLIIGAMVTGVAAASTEPTQDCAHPIDVSDHVVEGEHSPDASSRPLDDAECSAGA